MATKAGKEKKNNRGRFASDLVLKNIKRRRRRCRWGPGRGPQTAVPPGLPEPPAKVRGPVPAWAPYGAESATPGDSAAYGPAWGGDRGTDSLLTAPGPPGEDPGFAAAEPTPTHTPLRPRPLPQRPAPNLTVSPGSGWGRWARKGSWLWGSGRAKGAAFSSRPSWRLDTDTMSHKGRKCVSTSPSGTAPRFRVPSRRVGGLDISVSPMLDMSTALPWCSLPLWGSPPAACAPPS